VTFDVLVNRPVPCSSVFTSCESSTRWSW